MSKYDLETVTLAAALIKVGGDRSTTSARKALEDARWLLNPKPDNLEYKNWQMANKETPTTDQEDRAAAEDAKAKAKAIQKDVRRLMQR